MESLKCSHKIFWRNYALITTNDNLKTDYQIDFDLKKIFDIQTGWTDLGPKWSDWSQMEQIWDFFRLDFSTFWHGASKYSEI